jgi:hypothetical protein
MQKLIMDTRVSPRSPFPIRRLYINRFDPEHNKVQRLYPPRIKKKMLTAQALKHFT